MTRHQESIIQLQMVLESYEYKLNTHPDDVDDRLLQAFEDSILDFTHAIAVLEKDRNVQVLPHFKTLYDSLRDQTITIRLSSELTEHINHYRRQNGLKNFNDTVNFLLSKQLADYEQN